MAKAGFHNPLELSARAFINYIHAMLVEGLDKEGRQKLNDQLNQVESPMVKALVQDGVPLIIAQMRARISAETDPQRRAALRIELAQQLPDRPVT